MRSRTEDDAGLGRSVARLQAWYAELDADLLAAIAAISDDEFASGVVTRGDGFETRLGGHFHTYREVLIIFCGCADAYLRAMGKPRSEQLGGSGDRPRGRHGPTRPGLPGPDAVAREAPTWSDGGLPPGKPAVE